MINRCAWARNEYSIRYHDEEWGVPVHDDRLLFEFLVLEGARAPQREQVIAQAGQAENRCDGSDKDRQHRTRS